jgi:hypothetical protein
MPTIPEQRWFALPPLFDPEQGTVVRQPEGSGPGFWVGAPSAIYDVDRARALPSRRWNPRSGRAPRSS